MEMSEGLSQQGRLQAIAEKRKRQTEIENKKRQLEDDRRQLQHLKSKALRERWLLDGAPSAGSEQDEARKQLQEDEAKIKELDETIIRMEQELEELETGVSVSATSTKESLSEVAQEEAQTADNKAPVGSVEVIKVHNRPRLDKSGGASDMMKAAMYSVEITVERDRVTGETKVLSTNTLLPVDFSQQGVKVYEDERKVVHEVREGTIENGFHQLSSSEVDELIHKADEASMISEAATGDASTTLVPKMEAQEGASPEQQTTPSKEITGMEAKPGGASPQPGGPTGIPGAAEASADNPVTMVFMGYQNVEDEAETKKVLGLEGTVKAELVVIEDSGEGKTSPTPAAATVTITEGSAKEEQSSPLPPNGSAANPAKAQAQETAGEEKVEPEGGASEPNNKEKQPCKCCTIM